MEIETLPIPQQIEILKGHLQNNEDMIRHYGKNPLQLDELKFKIQTQGLQNKNTELFKKLRKLESLQNPTL